MVEGIDALGRSLLGRQDTFKEQEEDIKKQRRKQRKETPTGDLPIILLKKNTITG